MCAGDRFAVGRDGAAKVRRGVLQAALPPQLVAEVEVSVAEPGLELHRALEAGLRGVEPALTQVDVAEIVLRGGELRIERDRAGDERMRFVEPAGLQGDDAKQMHRIEMFRRRREDLAVRGLRVFESTRLMVRDRDVAEGRRCHPRMDPADLRASSCGDFHGERGRRGAQSCGARHAPPDRAAATTAASS